MISLIYLSLGVGGSVFSVYYRSCVACVCTGCSATELRCRCELGFRYADSSTRVRWTAAMNSARVAERWCTE